MFYAFRDRVESLGVRDGHQLGLIQFDDKIDVLLQLSSDLAAFENSVDNMKQRGATAIYEAILSGVEMLEPIAKAHSRTDLRVVLLTDGQNNQTKVTALDAFQAANRVGVVVDAILVGSDADQDLRRIVQATGGECYRIGNIGEGFELLEAENVVSLRARRGGAEKPLHVPKDESTFLSTKVGIIKQGAAGQNAAALAPTKVVALSSMSLKAMGQNASSKAPASSGIKRIMQELAQVARGDPSVWLSTGEGVHICPGESDVTRWRVLVEAPAGSPFAGGVFALVVTIPSEYPTKPPTILFETPVYHCNVSESGTICLDLIREKWTAAFTVPKALEAVCLLLQHPNPDAALRQWIAEVTIAHRATNGADCRYAEAAAGHTRKHAARTVAEWYEIWGC